MSHAQQTFIPAAGHDWLLPFYDPFVKLLGTESAHRRLVDQAQLQPGQRILEIGCGTGNLTILVKTLYPTVEVVGLDPDPKALARARRKAERQGVSIQLDRGFSNELQYPDRSYDRVLSAFMFHHLNRDEKKQSLHEIWRVLTPGGSLHLLDFGGGHDGSDGLIARLLHRSERVRENSGDTILTLMQEAGFVDPTEVANQRTILGRIFYYHASPLGRSGTGAV
jgi:ubiquinone/menaquinone biosynthesis C-methylase UbiE